MSRTAPSPAKQRNAGTSPRLPGCGKESLSTAGPAEIVTGSTSATSPCMAGPSMRQPHRAQ